MQDYVKLLEATRRASVHRKASVKAGAEDQFSILQMIEDLSLVLRQRLEEVLPSHLGHHVSRVKLELIDTPIDAPILYRAQFYRHDRKNFQLRVYAHQQGKKGRGVKLARAVYHISIRGKSVDQVA